MQRSVSHSTHKSIHNNIQVLKSLFMDHIHQLTGNGMSYLIIDKISNTIEKEIVWPLEDIFWPFIRKCAIKGIWLQRNEIISETLTQRKQQRKKAIKKNHSLGDFNERNTASLKLSKRNKYRQVSFLKRPKGRTIKLCQRITLNT